MNNSLQKLISLLLTVAILFSMSCEVFADGMGNADPPGSDADGSRPGSSGNVLAIPAAAKSIEEDAFYGDESLEEVILPYGAKSIGPGAFAFSGLQIIHIPETVDSIDGSAFEGHSADFTIYAPMYSYAYEYALSNQIKWADTTRSGYEDAVDVLNDDFFLSEDAELTIDQLTFDLIPEVGITDPEELRLVREFNEAQSQLTALNQAKIEIREYLTDSFNAFQTFAEDNSFTFSEGNMHISVADSDFTVPYDVLDSLDEDAELIESRWLENGAQLLVFSSNGSSVYLKSDSSGLFFADASEIEADYVSPADLAWNDEVSAAAVSPMQNLIDFLKDRMTWFNNTIGGIDDWLSEFGEELQNQLVAAETSYNKIGELNTQYPGKYTAKYQTAARTLVRIQFECKGFAQVSTFWRSLNLASAVSAVGEDLGKLLELQLIANHEHPTESERKDPEISGLIEDLKIKFPLIIATITVKTFYDTVQLYKGFDSLFTLITAVSGPAGWGFKLGIQVSLAAIKRGVKLMLKSVIIDGLIAVSTETAYDQFLQVDKSIHNISVLSGTITDSLTGAAIPDVTVTLQTPSGDKLTSTADANGKYRFVDITQGTYSLSFERTGYEPLQSVRIIKTAARVTVCSIRMVHKDGSETGLSGTVTDSQWGTALQDVTVTLLTSAAGAFTATTEADGRYSFTDIPPGTHRLSFERDGYKPVQSVRITVAENRTASCNMHMVSTSEPPIIPPDGASRFWAWCIEHYDADHDGALSQAECLYVESMDCSSQYFGSMNGIRNFTNLKELNCPENMLTSLDVSGLSKLNTLSVSDNMLESLNVSGCSSLKYLFCNGNRLSSLDLSDTSGLKLLYCDENDLRSLNVSNHTELSEFSCFTNQLVSLNISGCSSLQTVLCYGQQLTNLNAAGCSALTRLECDNNQLDSLNLTGCSALEELSCHDNQLTDLDVTGNSALTRLSCGNNRLTHLNVSGLRNLTSLGCEFNSLTSLDVSGCSALTYLICPENPLMTLNAAGCTALPELYCDGLQLVTLDVSDCSALTMLDCSRNQLASLDLTGCTSLITLECSENNLTSLDVSDCSALEALKCADNQLTDLDVSGCTALTQLFCWSNLLINLNTSGCTVLPELNFQSSELETLNVSGCSSLQTLDCCNSLLASLDVTGCAALTRLDCSNTQLTSLDLSSCTALTELDCSSNMLTSLDVSACAALEVLRCVGNQLINLNVAGCSALTELQCFENKLQELNVSGLGNLTNLDCQNNRLTSLNLSGCRALTMLDVSNYLHLTSLNASGCSSLEVLKCIGNQLTSLDVTGCSALVELQCFDNKLPELNVSGLSNLTSLGCQNNKLTSLSLSGCSALTVLACFGNELTSLDVTDCSALTDLDCSSNMLTGLNVSWLTNLTSLSCQENSLTSLNLSGCSAITELNCWANQFKTLDVSDCALLSNSNIHCNGNVIITR